MEQAGAGLLEIMAGLLRATPADEAPIMAWPAICGRGVAARTRALRFSAGVLFVETPDKTWQTQLLQLESGYLRAFATLLGKDRVKKIEFVVAG
jgi:predicted nucleic acid-binding Zn ribbon protein